MDNFITGVIALAILMAFVFGLAESISALPFTIIVILVVGMAVFDFYQSVKESRNGNGK